MTGMGWKHFLSSTLGLLCCLTLTHATTNMLQHFSTHTNTDFGSNSWYIKAAVTGYSLDEEIASMFVKRVRTPKYFEGNHSCFDIKFRNNYTSFCYPLVTIGGFAKCGTSSIYHILSSSRKVHAPKRKEECNKLYFRLKDKMLSRKMDMQALWEYFYWMSAEDRKARQAKRKFVVSGCLQVEIFELMSYLLRNPSTSIVLATRDFANRAYSVYNYFCSPDIDADCTVGQHTSAQRDVRSPWLFHKMIQDLSEAEKNHTFLSSAHHIAREDWHNRASFFRQKVKQYETARSGDPSLRIFVVAMEAIDNDPQSFWYKLKKFLRLPQSSRYNFGEVKKSFKKHINPAMVSAKTTLRNDTRAILNREWREDCLWTSRAAGYRFPACHPS